MPFFFKGAVDARNALAEYLDNRTEALPEDIRPQLRSFTDEVSRTFATYRTIELVYARRADLAENPVLCDMAAGMALMAFDNGFFQMDQDRRGERIAAALRRDAGLLAPEADVQDVGDDPEPLEEFVPAEEAAESEVPAGDQAG